MKIIPAIDIINGQCVRLSEGDYDRKKIYKSSPVDWAKEMEDAGIQYLHLVDLDGAKAKKVMHHKILEQICTQTQLKVDFGGGIRTMEDAQKVFDHGAYKLTGGSIAVKKADVFMQILERFGADKIILGADCKNEKIATDGWLEKSEWDILDFLAQYEQKGIKETVCTDISKDGMLQGPSFELYQKIIKNAKIQLIASGGIRSIEDLKALKEMGCSGAIVGKALYEGYVSLKELSELC